VWKILRSRGHYQAGMMSRLETGTRRASRLEAGCLGKQLEIGSLRESLEAGRLAHEACETPPQ